MRGRIAIAAVSLSLAGASVSAQTNEEQAKKFFLAGNDKVDAGDLEGALADYRAAYAIIPRAKILINIGAVLADLDRIAELANTWQDYLDHPDRDPRRANKVKVVLGRLDEQVSRLRLIIAPGSEVSVNGEVVAQGPAIKVYRVEPGRHRVVATFQSGTTKRTVVAQAGAEKTVELEAPKEDPIDSETQRTSQDETKTEVSNGSGRSKPIYQRAWIYTMTLALGAGATGGVFFFKARTAIDDYEALLLTGMVEYADAKRIENRGRRHGTFANIGFVTAGALAATSAVLLYLDLTGDSEGEHVAIVPIPGGAMMSRGWTW